LYRTARTTPLSRAFLVAEAERIGVTRAARNMGVSRRTVARWRRRAPDFADRPCRPHRSPRRTADAIEAAVLGYGSSVVGVPTGSGRASACR